MLRVVRLGLLLGSWGRMMLRLTGTLHIMGLAITVSGEVVNIRPSTTTVSITRLTQGPDSQIDARTRRTITDAEDVTMGLAWGGSCRL